MNITRHVHGLLSSNIGPINIDIEKEKHVVYSHLAKHMERYPNVKRKLISDALRWE